MRSTPGPPCSSESGAVRRCRARRRSRTDVPAGLRSTSGIGNRYTSGANGPKPSAVRGNLAGERQREQRTTVKSGIKGEHGRAAGRRPRNLDGILDRLGAAVEERRLGRPADWDDLAQLARQRDVRLVWGDLEARMLQLGQLFPGAIHDAWRGMADIEAANPPAKSRNTLPSTSTQTGALGALEKNAVLRLGNAHRDETPTLLEQRQAARAR